MNELDLIKSLTAQASNKKNMLSTQTTTVIGEATSDSKDGKVLVDLSGETVSGNGEQSVEVDTTVSVKAGDTVRVSLVGEHAKNPCVTGVVGGGDRMHSEIVQNAACIASKVSIGKSGVEDISSTMLQNAHGVHVFNGELQRGDKYASIDSDSFDIKKTVTENGIDDAEDEVIASFGEETELINGMNKMVISSDSIYGIQRASNKKAFELNVNFAQRTYEKYINRYTYPNGYVTVWDYMAWPTGGVSDYSDLPDTGGLYILMYVKKPEDGAEHSYSWWYTSPMISMTYKDVNGTEHTATGDISDDYYSEDISIWNGFTPPDEIPTPDDVSLIMYVYIPSPRALAGMLGMLDGGGLPTKPYTNIQFSDYSKIYLETIRNDVAGSASIGTNARALSPNTIALGEGACAGARPNYQKSDGPVIAVGNYNKTFGEASTIFAVGNGTDENHRYNAFKVDKYGNIYVAGKIKHLDDSSTSLPYLNDIFPEPYYREAVLMDLEIDSNATARNNTTVRIDISTTKAQIRLFNGATELSHTDQFDVAEIGEYTPGYKHWVEYDIYGIRNASGTDEGTYFSKQTLMANLRVRMFQNGSSYSIQVARQKYNTNNSCQAFSDPTIVFQDNKAASGSNITVPHPGNISIQFLANGTRWGSPRYTVVARCYRNITPTPEMGSISC